ncbi:transposase [Desulfolithobacter dissulfuricans]|uniref:Transposase n=1 Tax=Desulfolithobacter dissulfuricans TaxID=2795293 RepID=A0A915U0N7_9BACT|nr:IS21 family transposase [Desulfolithobacter dissulfuricans]BCO09323.1 transposase [Desulfolithobacter dissulfuricans]
MDQYEFIRTAHRVYGKNISELSRMTGHSRNTVKKALRGEPWGYSERKNQPYPVLGRYLEVIDGWLEGDRAVPKKQRHTSRRIYHRLVEEYGYSGGESTVRRYVRIAKARLGLNVPGAFIPCDPEAGLEAEVDWGTATVVLGGKRQTIKLFCMRSRYSGKHFVRAYPCERQQAFFDAHQHGFQFFRGIFPVLIYDNLTTAVRKVLQGRNRIEQESFVKFRSYHNFEARFTNPAAGNEKGGVEGLVGFSRRNYLVPIPVVDSLEELNRNLLKRCQAYGGHIISGREHTVNELHAMEKERLLTLPDQVYSNQLSTSGKVDKFGTVIVDKNRYSVPTSLVGQQVSILLGVDRVSIYLRSQKVAEHERVFGNNKWQLDPDHYLDLLRQRPMAFDSARPIRQWRSRWPACYESLLERFQQAQGETRGIKDFLSVLMLHRRYTATEVEAAVELAVEQGISSSEGVRHVLIYANEPRVETAPLDGWETIAPADIRQYGQLGGVQ